MRHAVCMRGIAHACGGLFIAALLVGVAGAQEKGKGTPPAKPAKQPQLVVGTTLENLKAAYDGESNAHARYVEFARKADNEGYEQVASLFRAAARAEQIHAQTHAAVIEKLGGKPKADIKKFEAKATRENLEMALSGENYERLTMYPEYLAKARSDANADAMRTLNYAKTAEEEHAKLFKQAIDNLDNWKAGKKDFYVCAVCGYTVAKIDFEKCISCFNPKEKYEKVN